MQLGAGLQLARVQTRFSRTKPTHVVKIRVSDGLQLVNSDLQDGLCMGATTTAAGVGMGRCALGHAEQLRPTFLHAFPCRNLQQQEQS